MSLIMKSMMLTGYLDDFLEYTLKEDKFFNRTQTFKSCGIKTQNFQILFGYNSKVKHLVKITNFKFFFAI